MCTHIDLCTCTHMHAHRHTKAQSDIAENMYSSGKMIKKERAVGRLWERYE